MPAARVLLKKYDKARTIKTKARTDLQQTTGKPGPAAPALAEALWDVDTVTRYVYRRAPLQARRYFDYASLPSRANSRKAAPKPKWPKQHPLLAFGASHPTAPPAPPPLLPAGPGRGRG